MYIQEHRKTTNFQDNQLVIRDVNTEHTANGEAVLPKWEKRGYL